MAASFVYDVFLSHNAKDKPRVRRLAERLRKAGLRVWFDEWNVQLGDIIALKVDEGLEQSRVLLLCISPSALASGWVALERSTAIHRDPSNQNRRFIPLLLADCKLPDTIRRYHYLDFRCESTDAFENLLIACRAGDQSRSHLRHSADTDASRPGLLKRLFGRIPKPSKAPQAQARVQSAEVLGQKQDAGQAVVFDKKLALDVGGCVFDPSGRWLAEASGDEVRIWSVPTFESKVAMRVNSGEVLAIAFTPTGKLLCWSRKFILSAWDILSETQISAVTLDMNISKIRGVRTRTGDGIVCIVNDLESLHLLEWQTGAYIKTMEGHSDRIWDIAVTPDGTRAVSGAGDGVIKIWDMWSGECVTTFLQHDGTPYRVAISRGGEYVVSGGGGDLMAQPVKIWDVNRQMCVGTLEGPAGVVTSLDISPDAQWVAAACYNFDASLWHRESGLCLVREFSEMEDGTPSEVAFAPDSKHIFVQPVGEKVTNVYRITGGGIANSKMGTRRYVNAKVVLLGEGTVGKTSLAHRLVEDKYVVCDRTHGMNVWRLGLPLPPDATFEREALLWDLAGQEDYRLIHRLFLNETALALLLINPQKADPFAEVRDWLKVLKTAASLPSAARDVVRLLIVSQIDVGGVRLSNAKIEQFLADHGFAGWLTTSAKTGENCSDRENGGQPSKLKQLIAESIPWDKLPWTSTPRLLAELKNAVVTIRNERDIRLLRFAELMQRLEQALPGEKFGEPDVRTAVTLLANHGLARPLKFGDLVLLQPELLNGYAGAIIRAARANTDEIGCVPEAGIYRSDFDFTGVERLKHRADEELLLHALVQIFLDHSLCIAEETSQGRHLVFPSQYRREKDNPRAPAIFVSYTFSGEWQMVWATLVVRLWYSNEFERRELWRNAADFASGKGHTLGLKIDNREDEGMATISLYFDVQVEDVLKEIFIEYVHRHLARFGCEVTRDRRYICPNCGKAVKDHGEVRERLAAGKTFIYCQKCDEKVPLIDFIEQRLKSDPVARKILAMDETATRELDAQALEQILIGHMMATCGEADQIFRLVNMPDYGIDGEVEFKDNDGRASGKKVYVQLNCGNSCYRARWSDGRVIFDVANERLLECLGSQPVDVYLVIRQADETGGGRAICWMNVTRYLKSRKDTPRGQIVFEGEKLDMKAVWRVRDEFFPY